MRKETHPQNEMLKGTLDMMILRTLIGGDAHGHSIAMEEMRRQHTYPPKLQEQGGISMGP